MSFIDDLKDGFDDVATVSTFGLYNPGQEDATAAQLEAQEGMTAENARQYDQTREDLRPFREIGLNNLRRYDREVSNLSPDSRLDRIRNAFRTSPGHDFRIKQGIDAREQSAVGKSALFSGATLKGLERFAQGVASDEYNNFFNQYNGMEDSRLNRMAALAGTGQTSTNAMVNAGNNYSNNAMQLLQNRGDIHAADATSGVNNLLNFVNTGANVMRAARG